MMRSLAVVSFSLAALTACGPASDEAELTPAPAEAAQVEQEIGSTPDCSLNGYLQEQVTWKATCGACSEVGGDGSWPNGSYGRGGSLYQRCCTDSGTCGGWKLIRPVCTTC
jgi:hypothetical protein